MVFQSLMTDRRFQIFSIVTFLIWITRKIIFYYKSLPPGPWGMPILGYLPFMSNKPPHKFYYELAGKYGPVFSVKLGTNLIIGISCPKLVRDLFNRSDSTGRPDTPLVNLLRGLGIMLSVGSLWKRQRAFLHEKFRTLGVRLCPNPRFEKYVFVEIEELFAILDRTKGVPINPRLIFGRHLHNVICQLMMSFRFEKDDEEFASYNEKVARGMKLFGTVHIGEHFRPYLLLPGKQAVMKEITYNLKDASEFHRRQLEQRKEQRAAQRVYSEPADLLDHYLDRVDKEEHSSKVKTHIFPDVQPDEQIIQTMNDLFSAGMETSLATILWIMIMMVRLPHIAAKVREVLQTHVAVGQLVTMEHRLAMPYIEAVVFEVIRYVSLVPLGTVHVNDAEWHVHGHTIPAGCHIVPLINKMNMDPNIYPDPEEFRPERFIKDGKCNLSDYFQFGVGQRICLGTMLARMELFLFFANLMNTFDFFLPEGEKMPELEGSLGSTHVPMPYRLCFLERESD